MTTFESKQTCINKSPEELFEFLSDLSNLGRFDGNIPDLFQNLEYTPDSFSVSVVSFGQITFRITERIPVESVTFVAENTPVNLVLNVLLNRLQEKTTAFQLVAYAELNPVVKPFVSKPLQDVMNRIADMFAATFNR
ncbi:MAG: SRPBCC family protein [Bacteroidales bacterium]|nr:SRPBCC family protein [Bacteroidales bacterium]